MDNSARLGAYRLNRLLELKEKYPFIGRVQGLGLMIGLEFVKDRESKELLPGKVMEVVFKESLKRGDVQEIRMADAIIIAYRIPAYPVAFILVATRPSLTLPRQLEAIRRAILCAVPHGFREAEQRGPISWTR